MRNHKIRNAAVLAVCICFLLSAGSIQDAYAVDLSLRCSLTVSPGRQEALADADVVIDLYKVANAVPSDGYDAYTFEAEAPYKSLDGILSDTGKLTGSAYQELSQQAAALTLTSGQTIAKAADGCEVLEPIQNLSGGLYLLIARGRETEDYTVTAESEDGTEYLATVAYTKDHTYTFLPELIALPSKEADENGEIHTANPGAWIYDLEVLLKPGESERFGSLKIVKTLRTYETKDPASFVFRIDAYRDESRRELLYSDVAGITFTGAGEKSIILEDVIPIGAYVEVTEVYSGAVYKLVTDQTQSAVIQAEEVASVTFTNDHDDTIKGGGAVMNHFTYDADTGWGWTQE